MIITDKEREILTEVLYATVDMMQDTTETDCVRVLVETETADDAKEVVRFYESNIYPMLRAAGEPFAGVDIQINRQYVKISFRHGRIFHTGYIAPLSRRQIDDKMKGGGMRTPDRAFNLNSTVPHTYPVNQPWFLIERENDADLEEYLQTAT